ncbi:MAG: 50S ribosomal protein L24, partial [Candidatus Omnitrophica bacterium]|nr:50S ribosomal protein L24 [Candidatus Omnitrophota bacterium]
ILAGKDKGKSGKVLAVLPSGGRVIVQGINFTKKHVKRRRQDDQGGIIEQEASVNISNVSVVCKRCSQSVRISVDVLSDGSKVRYCKKCKEVL